VLCPSSHRLCCPPGGGVCVTVRLVIWGPDGKKEYDKSSNPRPSYESEPDRSGETLALTEESTTPSVPVEIRTHSATTRRVLPLVRR
jgi:hypothetical protein